MLLTCYQNRFHKDHLLKKTTGTHGRRCATRIAPAAAPARGRRRAKSTGSRRLVQAGGIAAATAGVLAVSVVPMPHPGASASLPAPLALKITGTATPTVAFAPSDAKVTFERVSVAAVAAPEAPPVPAASVVSAASSGPIQVSVPVPVPVSVQTETGMPASRLADPVAVPVRTSPFGLRTNPLTGEADEMHHGLDFGAACGTPVIASAEGTVTVAGWHPFGGGNRLEIDHGNGLKTTYNHLERIDVPVGQQMALGSKIATVGTTGNSTGCHLHFEVVLDGTPVDPEAWL